MSESPGERRSRLPEHVGIIDTIGLSFGLLNRRPYLIWILIVIDVIAWTGYRLLVVGAGDSVPELVRNAFPGGIEGTSTIELVNVLTWPVPNLLSDARLSEAASPFPAAAHQFDGPAGVGLVLLMAGIAIFLAAAYLTLVGRLVAELPARGLSFLTDSVRTMYSSIGIVAMLAGLLLFMILPFGAGAVGLLVIGMDPTVLLFLSTLILAVWLGLFFAFSIPALALGERNIFRAMRTSYQLVQGNFLAVVGLILIFLLVRAATPHALSVFLDSQWSIPFAIVVNAYIATGLIAAFMLFFQNRTFDSTSSTGSAIAQNG